MALLYVDLISQPSRACALLCRAAGLPVKEVLLRIDKKQHKSPDYLKINKFGKVPCLRVGDFCLPESGAILRYLCNRYEAPDHWYPADLERRAAVDCAMEWAYQTLRPGAAKLCWHRVVAKRRGLPWSPEGAEEAMGNLTTALQQLETVWLGVADGSSPSFMAGGAVSIADLLVVSELEQLRLLDTAEEPPRMADILKPYPNVRRYMTSTSEAMEPHYSEVFKPLYASSKPRSKL